MQINRSLKPFIQEWLGQRMVFVGGPRQVGKTYLAKQFLTTKSGYYSWDDLGDRELIKSGRFSGDSKTLVFDEVHKYPRWRSLLKGLYDKNADLFKILVTGSAQLDLFRKGGDSLFGRYHYFRLHPLTLDEVDKKFTAESAHLLLRFGGFPEPWIKQSDRFSKIWRRERNARVIQQDLRDLSGLRDYYQLELLADLLPSKIGSLLSLNSMAEDLGKSPHTIAHWIQLLSSVYQCYTILPYGPPRVKAIKKQQKLYLWDWTGVESPGARFENMVASHLLRFCHYIEDTEGEQMELRYLRDQYGHEIDFIVLKNKKAIFAVECKTGDRELSPSFVFFQGKIPSIKSFQVHMGEKSYVQSGVRILPFHEFCCELDSERARITDHLTQ